VGEAAGRARYRDVFAVGEFRVLWLALVTSVVGDQLARVALMVLVYDRTRSPLLAAVSFAVSYVPTFLGGLALSGLADRLPRRAVMITCDLIRMMLVAVMALPGVPVGVLIGLLFAVTFAGAPFLSARAALYPEILPGTLFVLGQAVSMTTIQVAQVAGFAAGGAIAGLLGARPCLLADAASFAVSAALIRWKVAGRPAARPANLTYREAERGLAARRAVFTRAELRTPMLLGWLAAFYNVPEGVAVPLAKALGGGAALAGLVLASWALGATAGRMVFTRVPALGRATAPLAVLASAVLVLLALRPGATVSLVILAASGAAACYQAEVSAAFIRAAPPQYRGQAFGIAQGGMSLGQGAMMIGAGAAVSHLAPALVIAAAGGLGAVAAVVIILTATATDRRA
jgi:MFS family permease